MQTKLFISNKYMWLPMCQGSILKKINIFMKNYKKIKINNICSIYIIFFLNFSIINIIKTFALNAMKVTQ